MLVLGAGFSLFTQVIGKPPIFEKVHSIQTKILFLLIFYVKTENYGGGGEMLPYQPQSHNHNKIYYFMLENIIIQFMRCIDNYIITI